LSAQLAHEILRPFNRLAAAVLQVLISATVDLYAALVRPRARATQVVALLLVNCGRVVV
jgi:hypothetical protein